MNHVYDAAFWDGMYRNRQAAWDEEPNPLLAEAVDGLSPGAALDVGCGEGSDAMWLAERGWQVTAVDISDVALDRGRAVDVDRRVNWLQADLLAWQPPTAAFDLVSMHFLHFPPADRAGLFGQLAQAVRPNGRLLMVSHHPSDLKTTMGRWNVPELYFTAEEMVPLLQPGRWEILECGSRPRLAVDPEGREVTIHDTVLQAKRIE